MTLQQHSEAGIPFEIATLDNLYSEHELSLFLQYVQDADARNRTFTTSNFKNGKVILPEWSQLMYDRISQHLPSMYIDACGQAWTFKGAPKYIMYARVEEGQRFNIHTDTGCEYDERNNAYSKFTVLTYLNESFGGGCTKFYNNDFQSTAVIQPKCNRTLIFDIDLFHSGEPVTSGAKYWIGTELVCAKALAGSDS